MTPRPFPTTRHGEALAGADGTATVDLTGPGNGDFAITVANIRTFPVPPAAAITLVPTGIAYVDGFQRDTSDMASNASSTTRIVLGATSVYRFVWTGCDVGARCTLDLSGILYPTGTAPAE